MRTNLDQDIDRIKRIATGFNTRPFDGYRLTGRWTSLSSSVATRLIRGVNPNSLVQLPSLAIYAVIPIRWLATVSPKAGESVADLTSAVTAMERRQRTGHRHPGKYRSTAARREGEAKALCLLVPAFDTNHPDDFTWVTFVDPSHEPHMAQWLPGEIAPRGHSLKLQADVSGIIDQFPEGSAQARIPTDVRFATDQELTFLSQDAAELRCELQPAHLQLGASALVGDFGN